MHRQNRMTIQFAIMNYWFRGLQSQFYIESFSLKFLIAKRILLYEKTLSTTILPYKWLLIKIL